MYLYIYTFVEYPRLVQPTAIINRAKGTDRPINPAQVAAPLARFAQGAHLWKSQRCPGKLGKPGTSPMELDGTVTGYSEFD